MQSETVALKESTRFVGIDKEQSILAIGYIDRIVSSGRHGEVGSSVIKTETASDTRTIWIDNSDLVGAV